MVDELERLNGEYNEVLKDIEEWEDRMIGLEGDPGAHNDCVEALNELYDHLERLTQGIEAVFFAKRKQEEGSK